LTDKRLLHTNDGGAHWRATSLPAPLFSLLSEISTRVPRGQFFVDGSTAWVAALGSRVTVTTFANGGKEVRSSRVPRTGAGTITSASLSFLDWNTGWVSVVYGTSINGPVVSEDLYKTVDGARSWTLVSRSSRAFGVIHFESISLGWVLQNPLLRTLDGGRTWTAQHVPVSFDRSLPGDFDALASFGRDGVLEARVPTGMLGYPVYLVTSNGGATWRARLAGDPAEAGLGYAGTGPPLSFSPVDALHWRASVFDHVSATDDGGLHWRLVSKQASSIFYGLSFATPDVGWGFTVDNCAQDTCKSFLEATSNGGRTWREVPLPLL
jgi:hypothetical protein